MASTATAPARTGGALDLDGPLAVQARRLTKLFGTTPALLRVDLDVPTGSVCVLIGGNGAGKTTLLRLLATAARPTSGSARVHGLDVAADPGAVRPLVDFLPATGGLYLDLTALENLRFCTDMRSLHLGDAALLAALERAGLGAVAGERLRTFSTGMLRRVALARLGLTRPPVALLDEPYAGLDDDGRELLAEMLSELRADGRTAIVATHEQERAGALADTVYRLERGIAAIERPALLEMPA